MPRCWPIESYQLWPHLTAHCCLNGRLQAASSAAVNFYYSERMIYYAHAEALTLQSVCAILFHTDAMRRGQNGTADKMNWMSQPDRPFTLPYQGYH
jgi:hypothetical protein